MKKYFLVAVAAVLMLGFTACCKDKKCCHKCGKTEVPKCAVMRAHKVVEPMVECLNLTEEETKTLENAFAEKFARDCEANKCFEEQLKGILGEERLEKMKSCPKCHAGGPCHQGRPCPPPCKKDSAFCGGCPDGPKPEGCCGGCPDGPKPEGCCGGEKPCCGEK